MKKIILFFIFISFFFGAKPALAASSTLENFWNKNAYFEFYNEFSFPTDGQYGWLGANMGTDLEIKNGVWYIFTREFYDNIPSGCTYNRSIIVVRTSQDQGKTWSPKTTLINAVPNGPHECEALDGDAFFDSDTQTWHYLYQCMARDNRWNLCHATRQNISPVGPFIDDTANPVIYGGDLWKKICPPNGNCSGNSVYDEGTPQIVEKKNGYYYVTFHGYDGTYGYRGVAKTTNFINWETVNMGPIFDKNDCSSWNIPWDSNGCVGGGLASILKENNYYYMLIETMDKNLSCMDNQNWVFGLLRSTVLENNHWENITTNPLVFSSKEKDTNGVTMRCGIQYQRIFRDDNGDIYLLYGRLGNKPFIDTDPVTGIYLYKLKTNLPFVFYNFREGPGHEFTRSDIVSRGNTEAKTTNVSWTKDQSPNDDYSLSFNGINSSLVAQNDPVFNLTNDLTLEVNLLITQGPTNKSAFIAGKKYSYWLELYQNGYLCAWINEKASGTLKNTCLDISSTYGQWNTYKMVLSGASLSLFKNDVLGNQTQISAGGINSPGENFSLGSSGMDSEGYYESINGQVNWVKVYDFAALPKKIGIFDLRQLLTIFINIFDYNKLIGSFGQPSQ